MVKHLLTMKVPCLGFVSFLILFEFVSLFGSYAGIRPNFSNSSVFELYMSCFLFCFSVVFYTFGFAVFYASGLYNSFVVKACDSWRIPNQSRGKLIARFSFTNLAELLSDPL